MIQVPSGPRRVELFYLTDEEVEALRAISQEWDCGFREIETPKETKHE